MKDSLYLKQTHYLKQIHKNKEESLSNNKLHDISLTNPTVDAFKSLAKIARKAICVSFSQLLYLHFELVLIF